MVPSVEPKHGGKPRRNMGTENDQKAPWETYSDVLTEKLDPKLEAEIQEYSQKRHEKSSEQNAEELARWEEGNQELAKQYQFLTPEEYADEGPRIGRILHSSLLIKFLQKDLGINCWYRVHPQKDKVTLVVKKDNSEPEVGCWVPLGYMPEFSIVRFDKYGVPLNEKYRGWRTCCLQLILKGVVTEEQVESIFGRAKGPASERYNSTLYEWRNRRLQVV
jgi:hypothetical protein